ncbi:hypothetical protein OG205_06315 [Lentzea sp. NBC_00516]|uniref:hypothetical protein n=1 Tax=Lentzea sp. NBC_00516 TaxID=2903582 RepID=UPI002E810030|nr:hypothetical protein [Lentzea sp. NBC_00516]WUD26607.1 hypothetical protein OG205_06315 [Lentzea sp. NBC_00516]
MRNLREVPSPGPEAYDRARTALHSAMTAAAVATAVVMGTTGGTVPADPPDAAPLAAVEPPSVKLAGKVKAAPQPGDSSLVITQKIAPDGSLYIIYTVYTDKGQVFHGDSVQGLAAAAARGEDAAHPYDAKVTAAARQAANGDVEKARVAMITASGNALGIGLSPVEADKAWADAQAEVAKMFRKAGKEVPAPKPRPTGKDLENRIGNHLWSNATYALFVGAANAEVRAGVLKLLAAMKEVTVGETDVNGRRALTLTGNAAIQGGGGAQVITVNADNGLPISSEVVPAKDSADPSKPSMVNYKSSRVHLADVVAGKI